MTAKPTANLRPTGFSLIEILTVVCIISILMLVALPNYSSYVRRAHRSEALAAMARVAQWMERAATSTGSYPPTSSIPATRLEVSGNRYLLVVESPDTKQTGTATFRITAIRNPQTSQATDECGDFVLDQANRRTLINKSSATLVSTCWGS
jgi:type IV pilus assembly protein PilE